MAPLRKFVAVVLWGAIGSDGSKALAQKVVLPPIHLVSCVMMGKLAGMGIVAVWCSAAEAQSPPWKQADVFPQSDGAMARALADPLIPLEIKEH